MAEIDLNQIDPRTLSRQEFADLLGSVRSDGAEQHRDDVAAVDPQAFARLIKRASSEQIDGVMSDPALRKTVLDEIFHRFAGQFRPEKAPRRNSALHWQITGSDEPLEYEIWIADGTCTASDQPTHEPRTTITLSGKRFLELVSGNGSPTTMFMTGKLELDGDIGFAAGLPTIFDIPKA